MIPIIIAVLSVAVIILIVLLIINQRKISKLSDNIENFIAGGENEKFSTADNSVARLQNSIVELENLIMLERNNTAAESKKNADFVADVSHQLKTPIAGLRLYCEMEQNNTHSEKQLQLISKMENLVYNLLRLEKIRSDAYVMNFTDNAFEDIIAETVSSFKPLFPNKTYSISGDATLRCDKEWMIEAVGNIIKNACEHTEDNGEINIIIEHAQKSVTLIIEDNGGGVPNKQLPLLFQRFYRAEKAAPQSAGIGLAISKAIFEKHHATVTAENGAKGLKITVCFPIVDANLKI